ncbi:POU domain, class 4, transcription factor 3-like isoform X3 [Branchiostoma floridae]|uniref:POU domain protein n=1 Tax=Branchiostoma floridae TaxID=7739 RepID=A0A9J7MXF1_BRAFL|nr:POU domain, class 4, transcription factor 3-like isoform X3 [Branchiostoma floridae]
MHQYRLDLGGTSMQRNNNPYVFLSSDDTSMMNGKQHISMHPPITAGPKYAPLHRTSEAMRRHCMTTPPSNIFAGLDESLLARAEALAAIDVVSGSGVKHSPQLLRPDTGYPGMNGTAHSPATSVAGPGPHVSHPLPHHPHSFAADSEASPFDQLPTTSLPLSMSMADPNSPVVSSVSSMAPTHIPGMHPAPTGNMTGMSPHHLVPNPHHPMSMHDPNDTDPRELEAFAEHFKQRRIKLGVTQADVGQALGKLKLPGVGSLSQSTICRFESLTLSHNNMVALKPVLEAWLGEAEQQARAKQRSPDIFNNAEKKRKRTSIAAPEKRSLEAYFAVQPRPSSEKIAAIAEKLDLKKNVVRVWFCNQRQKQKRMKFSAQQGGR